MEDEEDFELYCEKCGQGIDADETQVIGRNPFDSSGPICGTCVEEIKRHSHKAGGWILR